MVATPFALALFLDEPYRNRDEPRVCLAPLQRGELGGRPRAAAHLGRTRLDVQRCVSRHSSDMCSSPFLSASLPVLVLVRLGQCLHHVAKDLRRALGVRGRGRLAREAGV